MAHLLPQTWFPEPVEMMDRCSLPVTPALRDLTPLLSDLYTQRFVYWLVLCVNLTQAGVITEKRSFS